MKKTVIKLLSCILAAALILSAAPLAGFTGILSSLLPSAFAEEYGILSYYKQTVNGTQSVVINGIADGQECPSQLAIPGEIGGLTVREIKDGAFSDCMSLREVSFPAKLTYIGKNAFSGCSSLESAVINEDTGVSLDICSDAFKACTGLTNVIFAGDITVESGAFDGSFSVNSHACVTLQRGVTVKADAFSGLGISDTNSAVHYPISSVTALDNVTIEKNAFKGSVCGTVSLSRGVTVGENAFADGAITAVTVFDENINGESKASACVLGRGAFSGNGVYAGDGNGSSTFTCTVNDISITGPATVGENAFVSAAGGTVKLTSAGVAPVTVEKGAFAGCAVTEVIIQGAADIGASAFLCCTSLEKLIANGLDDGNGNHECITIGSSAFCGCTSLKEVNLYENITAGENSFGGCAVETLHIADYDASAGTQICASAFADNRIYKENGSSPSIKTLDLNGCISVADSAFADSLGGEINAKGLNGSNYLKLSGNAFTGANAVLLSIGDYVETGSYLFGTSGTGYATEIKVNGDSVVSANAFKNCGKLESVILGSGCKIGEYAFYGCDGLKSLIMFNGVTLDGGYNFGNCSSLPQLCLPEDMTQVPDGCFAGDAFETVYIPASFTTAGSGAFLYTADGTVITYKNINYGGTQESLQAITGLDNNGSLSGGEVNCNHTHTHDSEAGPVTLAEASCEAAGWLLYTCNVCGLEYAESSGEASSHIWFGEPTCKTQYTCIICGKASGFNPDNHEGGTEIRNASAATCTKDGYTGDTVCLGCDTVIEYGEVINKLCHSFTNYTYSNDATCLSDGTETAKCDRCYATDTCTAEGTKLEHSYTVGPYSNGDGTHSYKCVNGCNGYGTPENCDYKITTASATCTNMGETKYTCTTCGYSYPVEIPVTSHIYDNGTILQAATCCKLGWVTYKCTVCGATDTVEIPPDPNNHTGLVTHEAVPATCTTEGKTEGKYCNDCKKTVVEQQTVPATGHSYETSVTAATCTTKGFTIYTCRNCNDSYISDYTDAPGHNWNDGEVTEEAKCVETGTKTFTCKRCGQTETEEIPLNPDNHKTVVTYAEEKATCTKNGRTAGSGCTACGKVITEQKDIPATGHSYSTIIKIDGKQQHLKVCSVCAGPVTENCSYEITESKAPTCTEKGVTVYKCNVCGDSYTIYSDPTGHDYQTVSGSAKNATCTAAGKEADKKCTNCSDMITGALISAKGHTIVKDEAIEVTCTTDGKTEGSHCSACGEILVAQTVIASTGHNYVPTKVKGTDYHEKKCSKCGDIFTEDCTYDAITTKAATCTEKGEIKYSCISCGDSYSEETAPLNHSTVIYKAKAPTCTEHGWYEYETCTRCDYTTYKEIPATGHTVVTDEAVPATCTATGLTEGTHCSVCKQIITAQETTAALGHDFDDTIFLNVTATPATCTQSGSVTVKCSRCDETETTVISATGHDYQEIAGTAKAPTCTESGKEADKKCTRCNDTVTGASIPAKGHTPVTDPAVPATESATGLTEGSHCSVCNAVIVAQQVTEKLAPSSIKTVNTIEKAPFLYAKTGTGADEISAFAFSENAKLVTGTAVTKNNGDTLTVIVIGDVDGDGAVTVADARLCLRRAINLQDYQPGTAQYIACDATPDGSVQVSDARLILRAAINLEDPDEWYNASTA